MKPSQIILDYAHKVSEARKILDGFTTDELNAYQQGLLKAVELLQDEQYSELKRGS